MPGSSVIWFVLFLELFVGDPRIRYKLLSKIGSGSTASVWKAKDVLADRLVAVKLMDIRRQQRRELLFNEVVITKT